MKITGQIALSAEEKNSCSVRAFSRELVDWAANFFGVNPKRDVIWINVESGQQGVDELFRRIRAESDKLPSASWQLSYSASDLDQAKFLLLWSDTKVAELLRSPDTDRVTVISSSKLKDPRLLGQLYPFPHEIAVNQQMKEQLISSGLVGVDFTEIGQSKPRPEHKPIWLLAPSKILPASPMTLKKPCGEPFDGDFSTGCQYQQCYPNIELSYFREDIEAMGDFDAAATRELIGNYPNGMFRYIVVSQRFRAFIRKHKVPAVRYAPVRMLNPGDPPVRNPFDELMASFER